MTDGTSTGIALLLAYEGGAYHGWQVQPDAPTIQGTVAAALAALVGEPVRLVGASRTDAGVHALGQVAAFVSPRPLAPGTAQAALNARLPADIRVLAAVPAPPGFDARRAARLKRYAYVMATAPVAMPFHRRHAWHLGRPLDLAAMRRALAPLRGRHDFSAFRAAAGRARDPVCTLRALRVVGRGSLVVLAVSGDAFLHHMVRNIVGTVVEVGRGRRSPGWVAEVMASGDRRRAGATAPAHGLFLTSVRYACPLFPGSARRGAGGPPPPPSVRGPA